LRCKCNENTNICNSTNIKWMLACVLHLHCAVLTPSRNASGFILQKNSHDVSSLAPYHSYSTISLQTRAYKWLCMSL
jgi:hypothetical protein